MLYTSCAPVSSNDIHFTENEFLQCHRFCQTFDDNLKQLETDLHQFTRDKSSTSTPLASRAKLVSNVLCIVGHEDDRIHSFKCIIISLPQ